jgi:hypothetical protein
MTAHVTPEAFNAASEVLANAMHDALTVGVTDVSDRTQELLDAVFGADAVVDNQTFCSLYAAFMSADDYRSKANSALESYCYREPFISDISAFADFMQTPGVARTEDQPLYKQLSSGHWRVHDGPVSDEGWVLLEKWHSDEQVFVPTAWFTDREEYVAEQVKKAKTFLASQPEKDEATKAEEAARAERLALFEELRAEFEPQS